MTSYLFLDGNCLRARVRKFKERYAPNSDLNVNWIAIKAGFDKVFYYDAIPVQKPGESQADYDARKSPIVHLHAQLANIDGFRVNEGDSRYRSGRGQEQKKVDIMIAVDMMTHTVRRNMSRAALLAGDLDFKPLLDAVVTEGMFVTLIYPPAATSAELLAAADAREAMSAAKIYRWLDDASRKAVGKWPTHSRRNGVEVHNCALVQEVEGVCGNIRIWHELTSDTITVDWPWSSPETFETLSGADWHKTRLVAEEDHGLDLPAELPSRFAGLHDFT